MPFSTKSRQKINWSLLLIEAFLVVLSVLLALGLNSWRESRANNNLALRALSTVSEEFSVNCSRIQDFQEYHLAVANGERDSEGLQIGLIRNDSWDSAQSTGATAHIEFETASIIGQIYASQSDHRTLFQSYIEALFTKISTEDSLETAHGKLDVVTIRELVRIQDDLLTFYSEFEEALETNYGRIVSSGFDCTEN